MKRVLAGLLVLLFSLALVPATAEADLPDHGHILLLHMEFENGEPVGFARCIDLANSRHVPLHAHHGNLHDQEGRGAQALARAGHMVVPTAPLTPWTNCTEFVEIIFGED